MSLQKADNDKYIDTDKMDKVLDFYYDGSRILMGSKLYRTKKTHQWYRVIDSGCEYRRGNIPKVQHLSLKKVMPLIVKYLSDKIDEYEELLQFIDE